MTLPPFFCAGAEAVGLGQWLLRAADVDPGGNMLLSPWDLGRAIRLMAAGAAGTTLEQLQALGMPGGVAAANPATGVALHQGSFLWASPELPFAPPFATYARDEEALLSAAPPGAVPGQANAWVARLTRGMITEAVRNPPAPGSLLLITALAFEGRWAVPFEARRTEAAPFHRTGGPPQSVRMMRAEGRHEVAVVPGGTALRLPYSAEGYSMLLLLPEPGIAPADWLSQAGEEGLASIRLPLGERPARIGLPRMDLRLATDMVPILTALGAPAPFDPHLADFSPMVGGRGPFIGAMQHQMAIMVNEAGTRAAASTTITMPTGARPLPPVEVIFDRPFLFLIEGPAGGPPLFMGIVATLGDST